MGTDFGVHLLHTNAQARDLNLNAKPQGEGASRNSFQKLTTQQSLTRASESVVRVCSIISSPELLLLGAA